jgi:plasmid replication initiation protein
MARPMEIQGNLFTLDSPLLGEILGERTVAEFPFFALKKARQLEPMTFQAEGVTIELSSGKHGIATIYDKEILLYVASIMTDLLDRGGVVARTIRFTAHDLFRITGSNASKRSYTYLIEALRRLRNTIVETNIATGGEIQEDNFSWLDHFRVMYAEDARGEKRVKYIEVTVCDWFYRAVLRDRRLAAYDLDYFTLTPIQRRLYELAMFHCEPGHSFELGLEEVAQRMGCGAARLRNARAEITKVAEQDSLPGYTLSLHSEKVPTAGRPRLQTFVTFTARESLKSRRIIPQITTLVGTDEAKSDEMLKIYEDVGEAAV